MRSDGPIKITVTEPDSGEILQECLLADDYCVILAGNRYVKSMQIMGTTHMIAIAIEKGRAA